MIECDPIVRAEVVQFAVPPETASVVQTVAAPSLNVTVPPGVATPGPLTLTFAVNVTGAPVSLVVGEELATVVVAAVVTNCVIAEDVDALVFVSPL